MIIHCKECRAIYKTKYQKGDLKAVAYNQAGARIGMDALYTSRGEIGISVKPETETAKPGQIVYVDVSLTGENGEMVSIWVSGWRRRSSGIRFTAPRSDSSRRWRITIIG